MADKNQLKFADPVDLAEDDPFAELTRIMGFDPRQPARQPAAPPPAQAVETPEDDFSLDLEKELLGGFDMEDELQAAPVADEPVAEAPAAAPEAHEPETDFDFAGEFDAAMATPDAFEVSAADEPDLAFDGDLDAAFAAAVQHDEPVADAGELDFDLALTDEDMQALGEAAPAPAPLPVAPEAVAQPSDIDAELDAAMADIDMDFLGDERASEPALEAAEPVEAKAPQAVEPEADLDPPLFDESDFRFEEEFAPAAEPEIHVEAAPEVQAGPEVQPEIDETAFQFDDDAFRLDDVHHAEELPVAGEEVAAPAPVDDFSFDDVDFAAGELAGEPVAAEVSAETPPPVAEPVPTASSEPKAPAAFEFSVPAYVPRKLPTSPMDVAAEEFRQREATAAPEPQFNLEDELNALLGNIRTGSAEPALPVPAASAPVEEQYEPAAYQPPAYEPAAYEPPSYQPAGHSVFGTSGLAAREEPRLPEPEPVGFDAPEQLADIDDNLNWELDDAFAAEATPDPVEEEPAEAYAEDQQADAYYGEEAHPGAAYAERYDAEEEPAPPVDLDAVFEQLAEEPLQPEPALSYRDAIGAAAIGAAASRFGSGFASRPVETGSLRQPAEMPRASAEPQSFSPHRDPVVRGNPMKEDPLDIITQLAEKYSRKEPVTPYGHAMSVAAGNAPAYRPEDEVDGDFDISDAFEEQPYVETIEVTDQAIALADDLDIPELPEEEELPPASAYDDLDTEFSSLLNDMNADPRSAQPAVEQDDLFAGGFSTRPYETAAAAAPNGYRNAPARTYDDEPDAFALDADELPGSRAPAAAYVDDYEYDPDFDQQIAPQVAEGNRREPRSSRGLLLAGLVGGVALVGAVGAFALSFGGGGDDTPAIVRADDNPVKVKPENPGGTTVPNQDNKVYETVAGANPSDGPQQEKLVTTAEEPMDVTPPPAMEEDNPVSASGKNEDRIEQIVEDAAGQTDAEIVAVAPRKVRTMVVRPDGTLVPREDEPGAAPSDEQTDTIAAATPDAAPAPIIPEATGALPEPAQSEPTVAAAEDPAAPQAEEDVAALEPASQDRGAMPDTAPIAPMRPADQPIDVVGEVQPDQVAAATTAAASGGSWAMQIASQPSEAAAQSSYQDLARRYGSVLQGREVNIVKAEISGKGTFWRVRVPANSRNEAISLCENYKAAGGNCFVSR